MRQKFNINDLIGSLKSILKAYADHIKHLCDSRRNRHKSMHHVIEAINGGPSEYFLTFNFYLVAFKKTIKL